VNQIKDDRIYPVTRIIAGLVVPILVLAFIILYFFPERSKENFAWEIKPAMTAAYMGAGYLGGAWLFTNALYGKRWHRVASGFLPVTAFTTTMLLTTIIHWSRFDLRHFPFLLWLVLYIVTPFLVPWLWLRNRLVDPGTPDESDQVVPIIARWGLRIIGLALLLVAIAGFFAPNLLIRIWPWGLTPLTARILSGWFSILGVGGIVIGRETRWSSWRVGLQSIGIWHLLVVVAAFTHPADFTSGLLNWYLSSVILVLVGMGILYWLMERRKGAK